MNYRSKSTLFLMEQLIVVAIFAICAAACVRILTESYFMATETRQMNNAIRAAENGAECFKAVLGDVTRTAEILGGRYESIDGAGAAVVYYDRDWRTCAESDAHYILRLVGGIAESGPLALQPGELSIEKLTGEEILAFSVAARGIAG